GRSRALSTAAGADARDRETVAREGEDDVPWIGVCRRLLDLLWRRAVHLADDLRRQRRVGVAWRGGVVPLLARHRPPVPARGGVSVARAAAARLLSEGCQRPRDGEQRRPHWLRRPPDRGQVPRAERLDVQVVSRD